jgi:dolichol kinase
MHRLRACFSVRMQTSGAAGRILPYSRGIHLHMQAPPCNLLQRQGRRQELLQGPVLYGLAIVACTLYFWRTTPAGVMGIAVLCVGDGLAEVVGRRYGRDKLPHNKDKVQHS